MGAPKLLLPWPDHHRREFSDKETGVAVCSAEESSSGQRVSLPAQGKTSWRVIDAVLRAWTTSQVAHTIVVTRDDDTELHSACAVWNVRLLVAEAAPSDMKESIQLGLTFIEQNFHPSGNDGCFISPADVPMLAPEVIDSMIRQRDGDAPVIPYFGGDRGHPALLPWNITHEVFELGPDEGVKTVVERYQNQRVEFAAKQMVTDFDTPQAYRAAMKRFLGLM